MLLLKFVTNAPTKDSRVSLCVEASLQSKRNGMKSWCLATQNTTSHAHAAASPACLVLAEQSGAIKACKLIAQQNNSPSLIPV